MQYASEYREFLTLTAKWGNLSSGKVMRMGLDGDPAIRRAVRNQQEGKFIGYTPSALLKHESGSSPQSPQQRTANHRDLKSQIQALTDQIQALTDRVTNLESPLA